MSISLESKEARKQHSLPLADDALLTFAADVFDPCI